MHGPGLGRFMQPDPIGYAGGMNLYAYVGGNPVNFVGPFGLEGRLTAGTSSGVFGREAQQSNIFEYYGDIVLEHNGEHITFSMIFHPHYKCPHDSQVGYISEGAAIKLLQ